MTTQRAHAQREDDSQSPLERRGVVRLPRRGSAAVAGWSVALGIMADIAGVV